MSNDLGLDRSGNGNNWTVNNLAYSDQMVDSPTNNFATWNPLFMDGVNTGDSNNTLVLKEGNLRQDFDNTSTVSPTLNISSGKGYFEVYWKNNSTYGIQAGYINDEYTGSSTGRHRFYYRTTSGEIYRYSDSSNTSVSATYGAGDIIQFAWDMDSGKCWIGRNNTWYDSSIGTTGNPSTGANPVFTLTSSQLKGLIPHIKAEHGTSEIIANFGQDSSFAGNKTAQGNQDGNDIGDFYYTPPTGFLALCTSNLPAVAVVPSEHFGVHTRTGTGTSTSVTGKPLAPDLVWTKVRNVAGTHVISDNVRGVNKQLFSNLTNAEGTATNKLTAFNSDGYTLGADDGSGTGDSNYNGQTYVDWFWKANGSGSSNTTGTITSTVSANVDAGFSIVSYTGNGTAGATVGHGLSKAPEMIIHKQRTDSNTWWAVFHKDNGNAQGFYLNDTRGIEDFSSVWNSTSPSSSVITFGTNNLTNENLHDYVLYAFHSVDGYSKVGSYTGNGSTDGPFVYTGFKPAYIIAKKTDAAENWVVIDNARHPYNDVNTPRLLPNTSAAESEDASIYVDYLSNGFKIRATQNMMNNPSSNYIFLAFAEHPFKYSNAK